MPLYEYQCEPCDHTFETLIRGNGDVPHCPKCGSVKVAKLLSVPAAAQTGHGRAGELPISAACPPLAVAGPSADRECARGLTSRKSSLPAVFFGRTTFVRLSRGGCIRTTSRPRLCSEIDRDDGLQPTHSTRTVSGPEDSINSLISVFDNRPRAVHNPLAGGTRRCISHSIISACSDESTPSSDAFRRVDRPQSFMRAMARHRFVCCAVGGESTVAVHPEQQDRLGRERRARGLRLWNRRCARPCPSVWAQRGLVFGSASLCG